MSIAREPKLSPEVHHTLERKASRSEYYRVQLFLIAGASRTHRLVVTSILRGVGAQLRERRCELFTSAMREKVPAAGLDLAEVYRKVELPA